MLIFRLPSRRLMTRAAGAQDEGLDGGEEVGGVVVVELLGDVVGELEVLALVVADGDAGGVVGEDVGGHEVGVDVEAGGDGFAVLAGLVLELGHAVEPADAGDAGEDPAEADVGVDGGLVEEDVAGRVDAAGEEGGGHLAGGGGEGFRVLELGDGVEVDDAIEAVVVLLEGDPVADGAEVVAEGGDAGGLDAGEDALHGGRCRGGAGAGQGGGVAALSASMRSRRMRLTSTW